MRKDCWRETCWRFGPPVLWMAVISLFSTGAFSDAQTGRFLKPVLHWMFPGAAAPALDLLHFGIRKGMHLAEFGIFVLLWYRALGRSGSGWQGRMAAMAYILAVGFAGLDEMHQVFVPGRTASVLDVSWDGLGATLALMGRYAIWRS
jgi:hypothetical protein